MVRWGAAAFLLSMLLVGCGKNPYVTRPPRPTFALVPYIARSTPYITRTPSVTPTRNAHEIAQIIRASSVAMTQTAAWTPSTTPNVQHTVHAELTRLMRDAQTATAYRFPYTDTAVPSATVIGSYTATLVPSQTFTPSATLTLTSTVSPAPTWTGTLSGMSRFMMTKIALRETLISPIMTATPIRLTTATPDYDFDSPYDIAHATFDAALQMTWSAWTATYTPDIAQTVNAELTAMERDAQTATDYVQPQPYATLDIQPFVTRAPTRTPAPTLRPTASLSQSE